MAGPVGFGHALLSTVVEPQSLEQPASLDGLVWITADARVDDRARLATELESKGRRDLHEASDALLILHAYHAWGEDCVQHLLGDFSFGIWDGRTRRLFCARDHFGVKPFYYAEVPGGIVFSNTLDCVRSHPKVGSALDDLAVCDFLLFGSNLEPTTTMFADVRRLPPAHILTWGPGIRHERQYWTLPTDGRIRYRDSRDYVGHFREVLDAATSDRLRIPDIGVWMSGGLDSTSLTAIAHAQMVRRGAPFTLRAHTIVYDGVRADAEGHYARLAAEAIGVEIELFEASSHPLFDGWADATPGTPEPTDDPFFRMRMAQLANAASHSRVLLCGEGGDEVLWGSYAVDLLGRMRPLELAADILRSLFLHRVRPGGGLRARWSKWRGQGSSLPPYPPWLQPEFTDRFDLRTRWSRWHALEPPTDHPLRPEAHGRLAIAPWAWYFEAFDPGVTGLPLEIRYPFVDRRVVDYMLAIPPLPWCINKQILRLAMRDVLPGSVRLRRKAPLSVAPLSEQLQHEQCEWVDRFEPSPHLARYIVRSAVPPVAGRGRTGDSGLHLRPLCLNYWLAHHAASEMPHEETPDDSQIDARWESGARQKTVRAAKAGGLRRHS